MAQSAATSCFEASKLGFVTHSPCQPALKQNAARSVLLSVIQILTDAQDIFASSISILRIKPQRIHGIKQLKSFGSTASLRSLLLDCHESCNFHDDCHCPKRVDDAATLVEW